MAYKRNNYRSGRIGEEIKRIISDMLLRGLRDPAFDGSFVSVSAVKAANDGSFATVFVTMLSSGDVATDEEKSAVIGAFDKAKGHIRHEIGRRLGLRHVPELRFKFDTSEEYGRHIERILGGLDIPKEPAEKPINTVSEIADALISAETIRLFTHENMDGDTLGSAVALCLALRGLGKDCAVVVSEKIPDNIAFIENGCTVDAQSAAADDAMFAGYDIAVLVDVGETERIKGREGLFANADETLCIDHHVSSKPIYGYNLIDTAAAATAELAYRVIMAMGAEVDSRIATALYVGIVTDTGRFQYTNTTPGIHRITAELIEAGAAVGEVSAEVYQNIKREKIMLANAVMSTMETVAGGKGIIAYMTRGMLAEAGALDEEAEGIAEKLRAVSGVEASAFVRETEDGSTKASLRSKHSYDVAELAARFGGGGHVRAAGFTSQKPLSEVVSELRQLLGETL
ncbi:MAG: 30S ribosome-binding factor RbfA [Clostridiales Family XIII bacterium]|jgi:phosphoesterase RecJ-like protein|nr:30S ribosome-binding factor RbfA [Clostridiales Family XIII bacterium]